MNTMNPQQELELAQKIAALLKQDAAQIDDPIAEKLLAARKKALAHFPDAPAHAWSPVAAGGVGRLFEPFTHSLRAGLLLLALLAALGGVVAWHTASQQGSEIADIDTGLLTDELPINAYLDKGFDSWVKRHAN